LRGEDLKKPAMVEQRIFNIRIPRHEEANRNRNGEFLNDENTGSPWQVECEFLNGKNKSRARGKHKASGATHTLGKVVSENDKRTNFLNDENARRRHWQLNSEFLNDEAWEVTTTCLPLTRR